jgi:hypothetical protein
MLFRDSDLGFRIVLQGRFDFESAINNPQSEINVIVIEYV